MSMSPLYGFMMNFFVLFWPLTVWPQDHYTLSPRKGPQSDRAPMWSPPDDGREGEEVKEEQRENGTRIFAASFPLFTCIFSSTLIILLYHSYLTFSVPPWHPCLPQHPLSFARKLWLTCKCRHGVGVISIYCPAAPQSASHSVVCPHRAGWLPTLGCTCQISRWYPSSCNTQQNNEERYLIWESWDSHWGWQFEHQSDVH